MQAPRFPSAPCEACADGGAGYIGIAPVQFHPLQPWRLGAVSTMLAHIACLLRGIVSAAFDATLHLPAVQAEWRYGQSFLCITAPNSQLNHIARATGVRALLPPPAAHHPPVVPAAPGERVPCCPSFGVVMQCRLTV
jgi:hypothetical protein